MAFKNIIAHICMLDFFRLPPLEKRRWPEKFVNKFLDPGMRIGADDTYIFWKMFLFGLIVSFAMSGLYLYSYLTGETFKVFWWFPVEIKHPDIIRDFAWGYGFVVYPVTFIFVALYGWVLFKVNKIDVQNQDLMWWNESAKKYADKKQTFVRKALWINTVCPVVMGGGAIFPLNYYELQNSVIYFFFILILFSCICSRQAYYSFWLICVNYQRKNKLGPRFSNDSRRDIK